MFLNISQLLVFLEHLIFVGKNVCNLNIMNLPTTQVDNIQIVDSRVERVGSYLPAPNQKILLSVRIKI
jgi:hypothetical protein